MNLNSIEWKDPVVVEMIPSIPKEISEDDDKIEFVRSKSFYKYYDKKGKVEYDNFKPSSCDIASIKSQ